MVCCAMLLGALAILLEIGRPGPGTIDLYNLAVELYRAPAGLLLIAIIATAVIEEKSIGK
jgi:hypothetical protein